MKSLKSLVLGLLAVVGTASGSLIAAGSTYYLNDHLATTIGTADAAGEIAALEADAFGSPVAGNTPSRYTGKPYDSDMGAFVFPFRNYRAQEGRWMSSDPSGFPDGLNGAKYAPSVTADVDPLGLLTVNVTGGYANNPSSSFSYSVGISPHSLSNLPSNEIGGQKTTSISPSGVTSSGYWVQEVEFAMNGELIDSYFEAAKVTVTGQTKTITGYRGVSISPFVDEFMWRFTPSTPSGSATIRGWANFYTFDDVSSPTSWSNNIAAAGAFYSSKSEPSGFSKTGAIYSWMKISWE